MGNSSMMLAYLEGTRTQLRAVDRQRCLESGDLGRGRLYSRRMGSDSSYFRLTRSSTKSLIEIPDNSEYLSRTKSGGVRLLDSYS